MIDATSRFHQCPVDPETSKLLTIVTNAGRFSYQVLPQGVCNSSALWNILTDGNSRIDRDLAILKIWLDIRLSPYNPEKSLHLVVDAASSIGLGFVFFQWIDKTEPKKGSYHKR